MERKTFKTIRVGEIILIINDKRQNATGLKKLLLPNAEEFNFGGGAGGTIKSYQLQIKKDKTQYYLVIGKSPKSIKKGKYMTYEYIGQGIVVPDIDTANKAFDLISLRIEELGGNLIEMEITSDGNFILT